MHFFFISFQSMELLILSKLQWDLTAITAYDYLDYLLTTLMTNSSNEKALKSSTEKLIAMCAAESAFMELPPSLIASASLASAVQQDFESNPPCSDLNLNEIVRKLQRVTKTEMVINHDTLMNDGKEMNFPSFFRIA